MKIQSLNKSGLTLIDRLGMDVVIFEAKKKWLWLHNPWKDVWFHPSDLKEEILMGRNRWGAVNWRLESPGFKRRLKRFQLKTASLFKRA